MNIIFRPVEFSLRETAQPIQQGTSPRHTQENLLPSYLKPRPPDAPGSCQTGKTTIL
jgi:hypothetical protein